MKIHSNEKLYTCDKYQKAFERKLDLQRHLKIHNTDEHSILKCDTSDQVFARKDNLEYHLGTS